jgi:hypothetical protein
VKDRVLALAGLLQSVRLVQEMANNGQVQTSALAPCIESLFRFDADSTEDVYGGVRALVPGLRRVVAQLDSEPAHWVAGAPPAAEFQCTAKTRYRQRDEACRVSVADDGGVHVRFERPQRAVTPGQSVVFYREDECLGGAVILSTDAGAMARGSVAA